VFGVTENEPEKYKEAIAKMTKGSTPYDMAAIYTAQNVIDPRDTRAYLKRVLDVHCLRLTHGVGQHLMRTWPTSY
jgi:acetyl-CoA carboxylase carboxyltransferase component